MEHIMKTKPTIETPSAAADKTAPEILSYTGKPRNLTKTAGHKEIDVLLDSEIASFGKTKASAAADKTAHAEIKKACGLVTLVRGKEDSDNEFLDRIEKILDAVIDKGEKRAQ